VTPDVGAVVEQLDGGLENVLGRAYAGMFLYGATMFPYPEHWRFDLDFHVLLARPLTDAERAPIRELYTRLATINAIGGDLDGYYITVGAAARAEPPVHQLDPSVRDDAWALHRAHVLAGRYEVVRGLDPAGIVVPPTARELHLALENELAFVESNPRHRAYGVLNAIRIVWSVEHRDVVVSKYEAAEWARKHFAEESAVIDAATRAYEGVPEAGDELLLDHAWSIFVERARRALRK
jgi:hypothetical protein